jgi:hypothetical protein
MAVVRSWYLDFEAHVEEHVLPRHGFQHVPQHRHPSVGCTSSAVSFGSKNRSLTYDLVPHWHAPGRGQRHTGTAAASAAFASGGGARRAWPWRPAPRTQRPPAGAWWTAPSLIACPSPRRRVCRQGPVSCLASEAIAICSVASESRRGSALVTVGQ